MCQNITKWSKFEIYRWKIEIIMWNAQLIKKIKSDAKLHLSRAPPIQSSKIWVEFIKNI